MYGEVRVFILGESFAILMMMRGFGAQGRFASWNLVQLVQGRDAARDQSAAIVARWLQRLGLLNKQLQPFSQTHPPPPLNSLTASIPPPSTPIPLTIYNGYRSKSRVPVASTIKPSTKRSPTKPLDPLIRARNPMRQLIDKSLTFFSYYSVKGIQRLRISNYAPSDI